MNWPPCRPGPGACSRPRGRLGTAASQVRRRRERDPHRPAAAHRGITMIGLSHFVYHDLTASLVPKWMSFPIGWTYLTGAGSLAGAAGLVADTYTSVPWLASGKAARAVSTDSGPVPRLRH